MVITYKDVVNAQRVQYISNIHLHTNLQCFSWHINTHPDQYLSVCSPSKHKNSSLLTYASHLSSRLWPTCIHTYNHQHTDMYVDFSHVTVRLYCYSKIDLLTPTQRTTPSKWHRFEQLDYTKHAPNGAIAIAMILLHVCYPYSDLYKCVHFYKYVYSNVGMTLKWRFPYWVQCEVSKYR